MSDGSATALFGAGCFWCIEACFNRLRGVSAAISGYAGGQLENPDYRAVCTGRSGHAEVVQIHFDPAQISYDQLLDVLFTLHDPTTLNRQGADVGSQYRSVIYYADAAQQAAALAAIARHQPHWPAPIVTEISPLPRFYPAEDYHQRYFDSHGHEPYCALTVAPKLAKFSRSFAALLK